MARYESWFKQDLKKPISVQMIQGNLFSADVQGNLIGVEVFDDGEAATLAGTVSANIIRPDGGTVAASGTFSGNKCSVVLPAAAYAYPGVATIAIKITDSGVVTTLLAAVVTIYRTSTDTVVDPGTIMPSIQSLITQIQTAVASIPADYSSLWTTLAPAYTSLTFPVKVGQYCTNGGVFYRAKQDIATSEEFTSSHWDAANIGNELSSLKSALAYNIILPEDTTWAKGTVTNTGSESATDYFIRSGYIAVEQNALAYLGVSSFDGAPAILMAVQFDSNQDFISRINIFDASANASGFIPLDKECAYVRLVFGHKTATGVTMSTTKASYLLCALTNVYDSEIEGLTQSLANAKNGLIGVSNDLADRLLNQEGYFYPKRGTNIHNASTDTTGYYVDASTGELVANASCYVTDYIDLYGATGYVSIYTTLATNNNPYGTAWKIAFYNALKEYISGVDNNGTTRTDLTRAVNSIPSGARYVRVSSETNDQLSYLMVVLGNGTSAKGEAYSQESIYNIAKKTNVDYIESTLNPYLFAENHSINLCVPSEMEDGKIINDSNGKTSNNSNQIATGFIDLTGDTTGYISAYCCYVGLESAYYAFFRGAFYDENKTFISNSGIDNNPHDRTDLQYATYPIPNGAKYFRCSFNKNSNYNLYMVVFGQAHPPYYANDYSILPIPSKISELKSIWQGKTWVSYGDSITAMGNGGRYSGWQRYVNDRMNFGNDYNRGIGGQTYKYNTRPWFANSDGSYYDRDDDGDMTDPASYVVPAGKTAHWGYFSSWDRIKTMIPDSIKDTIDLILLFGVNDGSDTTDFTPPTFSSSNTLDAIWAADTTYNVLGGDYDITTLTGAVASTLMKLQARCPKALIVIASGWSGHGGSSNANSGSYGEQGQSIWKEGNLVKQIAQYFSIPFIDLWGTSLVNPWNRYDYNEDMVHPYKTKGKEALARAMISGLMCIEPRFDV